MRHTLLQILTVVVLVGCSSTPVVVQFTSPEPSQADWYPIPADAPQSVEITDPVVAKIEPALPAIEAIDSSNALVVSQMTDSLGNMSLQFNRQPGLTWELIETALTDIDYKVIDKDRDNYKFQLSGIQKTGSLFSALFRKAPEQLNVVLIPHGGVTMVVVEGQGEEMPEVERISEILIDLQNYFQEKG